MQKEDQRAETQDQTATDVVSKPVFMKTSVPPVDDSVAVSDPEKCKATGTVIVSKTLWNKVISW